MGKNVFSTLSRPGLGAEDYLTESFVFLLGLLLEREPDTGVAVINRLSGLPVEARFERPESVSVSTQVVVAEGRPDIEIRDGQDRLVYVEVKHDSPLGVRQLERYLSELRTAPSANTGLVLLTRSRIAARETSLAPDEYHHVCWYEVHNWLAGMGFRDEVCRYLARGFVGFLEEKRMSMEKVSPEYAEGVRALVKLTEMMEASVTGAVPDAGYRKTAGWGWRGFNVGGFFYGVRPEEPLSVVFESNMGNAPTYKRDLDLEAVGFFSLSKDEQFECLVGFLQQASRDAVAS